MSLRSPRSRRKSVLIVLLVALVLCLVPHPKDDRDQKNSPSAHYVIAAHEGHAEIIEAENTCISVMLLGCMGFMMASFYLVNWPDEDIRRISWEVISSTISVFGSLLLFQGCNRVLEYYLFQNFSIWQQLAVAMAQCLLWFALLQFVLAYYSGALGENLVAFRRRAALADAESAASPRARMPLLRSAELLMHDIQLNTHAAAVLLGHATGFAAVNAWGVLQQAVPRNFGCCALVVPGSFFGISLIYRITKYWRHKKTMADGEEDEYEVVWGEHVAETEDEVISLAVSFLAVQMLRFCITGHLPHANGEDPEGQEWHSNFSCALLLLAGIITGGADVARLLHERSQDSATSSAFGRELSCGSKCSASPSVAAERQRCGGWFQKISAMVFAFCLLFAAEWWISSNFDLDGSMKAVVSALVVTLVAFLLIFCIDKVADMHFEDAELDEALRLIISALGMSVGFSWERCFDAAVGGLSEHSESGAQRGAVNRHRFGLSEVPAPVCNLILAVILAVLVLPAWKWYILPGVHASSSGSEAHSQLAGSETSDKLSVRVEDLGEETRLFGRLGHGSPTARSDRSQRGGAAQGAVLGFGMEAVKGEDPRAAPSPTPSPRWLAPPTCSISQSRSPKALMQEPMTPACPAFLLAPELALDMEVTSPKAALVKEKTGISSPSISSLSIERCTPRILSI